MKNYVVSITELLERRLVVMADDEDEAREKALDAYQCEKIILEYDDYNGYEVEVVREATENDMIYYDILEDDE